MAKPSTKAPRGQEQRHVIYMMWENLLLLCTCVYAVISCVKCVMYLTPFTTVWCVENIYLILTYYITTLCRQDMMTLYNGCPYLDTETPLTCLH